MNIGKMREHTYVAFLIGLLLLLSLACAQSGEILTPEEATATAESDNIVTPSTGGEGLDNKFEVGDSAILIGRGFLINLLDEPGGSISAGQERGATVEIVDVSELEGEIWYRIDASTGGGWVSAEQLEPVELEEEGPQAGDTVYLTGRGFLINLMVEPGGNRIAANQERGAAVTILEVTPVDGTPWYLVDAPTGEGWVAAENITTEAP